MNVLAVVGDALVAPSDLTIREVEDLRKDLMEAIQQGDGRATVALQDVKRIDTAAIQVLLAARKMAQELGGDLILMDAAEDCRSTVSHLGLAGPLFGPTKGGRD